MCFKRFKNCYIILITKKNLKNKMTAFYARDVFPKALNNSIYAKFKTDFSIGVKALSGGTALHHLYITAHFYFNPPFYFLSVISSGLQSAHIPQLQHRVSWGLFDLCHVLPHLNFIPSLFIFMC